MPRKLNKSDQNPAERNVSAALSALRGHPLFAPLMHRLDVRRGTDSICPADGWAIVTNHGCIHLHPTRRADPDEWTYVVAHCLLHMAFNHFNSARRSMEWNAACDVFVARFLADLKLGRAPEELRPYDLPGGSEESLYDRFCEHGVPRHLEELSPGGTQHLDLYYHSQGGDGRNYQDHVKYWQSLFVGGLKQALTSAIEVAAGRVRSLSSPTTLQSAAERARSWFITSYPLLGAMAAAFGIIEESSICMREQIGVAAVNVQTKEIYINPGMAMTFDEYRFVIAHEILHVGLMHGNRCEGRDPYLWNIACDFVVNGWLVEMNVGALPRFGVLYDPELKGLSAESVYDRIVTDMRRFRKLATLRGVGLGEVLGDSNPAVHGHVDDLDDFYRRAMMQGLEYHLADHRGYLPAGLVEAIRALGQPSIPWDVELAQWFDDWFEPLNKVRSYARPSRRQAATPDIPRPSYIAREGAADGRTFGVVLDTSGSMDRTLLAKALGAIASYSIAHEVPRVRVVFCDAASYDQGYLLPESIAECVQVKGRGGTVLQPAIDLLQNAEDFPKDGPLLIITDGKCDHLRIRRTHAFLIPRGGQLPFVPHGPVFRVQ